MRIPVTWDGRWRPSGYTSASDALRNSGTDCISVPLHHDMPEVSVDGLAEATSISDFDANSLLTKQVTEVVDYALGLDLYVAWPEIVAATGVVCLAYGWSRCLFSGDRQCCSMMFLYVLGEASPQPCSLHDAGFSGFNVLEARPLSAMPGGDQHTS